MTTFYTSDSHYGHTNILRYCNRPYKNTHEMNRALIDNWNGVVKPEDTVYHLGDVAMGNRTVLELVKELNGHKILIKGNHDRSLNVMKEYFDEVYNELEIILNSRPVILKHKPIIGYFKQWRQVAGHVHTRWQSRGRILNVGVDVWNYFPVREEVVVETLKTLSDDYYTPTKPEELEHDS